VLRIAGAVLTTVSAVLFLVVFLADLFGLHTNPYLGVLFFLLLPAGFVIGLVLFALGHWPASWPRIDLNDATQRATVTIVFALTIVNVVIVSMAAYRGVEYMDSVAFCGQVCHTPMQPEFVAHQTGAHANVKCVDCHVGAGASSFVSAKAAGTRRVLAVIRGNYSKPIVPAPSQLVKAVETCEECHSPARYHGDKVRRVVEYADNEKNAETVTTLKVHVGGGPDPTQSTVGIHWHANIANEIDYITTDDKRQVIPYVRLKDRAGNVTEFTAEGTTPEQLAKGERRRMDCMDCHNRPSHQIAASSERAVDAAIASGDIPRTLPFVRREAVKLLKASYPSETAAAETISRSLRDFYRTQHQETYMGKRQDVEKAVVTAQRIFSRNVFPEMNVQFGTYANNIGHMDFPGCFRCHDDSHKSKDGKKISQDCDTCHSIE
jgi:hypothetical protein